MNKWLKKGILILTVGCLMVPVSGCQADEVINKVLEKTDPKPNDDSEEKESVEKESNEPEVAVEKPEFSKNLSGSVGYKPGDAANALEVEAVTTDEGVISYQWYQSQTDTNGGGSLIEGATKSTFIPPTDAEGIMYYYVVATSTIGSSTNGVTSETMEVRVSPDVENSGEVTGAAETTEEGESLGTWQEADKGWWYDYGDGSYPYDQWLEIDGKWYAFDQDGYMRTGWYQDGDAWYYLEKSGAMAADTDVEGYHLGSDGKMQ